MAPSAPDIVESMVGGARVVRISGEINEKFDPRWITQGPAASVVVFDLDQLVRISSFGVSQWVLALEGLTADYYCFVRVRPAIVDQFNMVRAFAQRGELVSLYAPFRCPRCDEVISVLIDLRRDFALLEALDFPPVDCARCRETAELDELPDLYFWYVRSMPPPQPPPAAAAAIDGKPAAGSSGFHIEKDVAGMVTAFRVSGVLDEPRYFRRKADGVDGLVAVELSSVTAATEAGLAGLAGFLRELGHAAFLARITPPMIEPVGRMLEHHRLEAAVRVASVSLPFHCGVCQRDLVIEMDGQETHAVASGSSAGPSCPICRSVLAPAVSPPILERARRLPFAVPPEAIARYLSAHSVLGTGDDGLTTAMANPRNLLVGRYQVLGVLGEGGMGEVFLVRHLGPEGFSKKLVLKRIKRSRVEDPTSAEMLLDEARIAARLAHPNAVQVFGLERIGTEYFIAMEYVEGIDLARALEITTHAGMVWPVQAACRIVAGICAGLHAAHTWIDEAGRPAPIIHRDVSPENVLISARGEVKVADFGIASEGRASDAEGFRGKLGYAAPELLRGGHARPAADIYAAGAILYELLTLQRFRPGDREEAGRRAFDPPPRIASARGDLPVGLEAIYLHAVDLAPERRYSSADDLGRDLERIIDNLADRSHSEFVDFLARVVALSVPRHTTMTSRRSEVLEWTEGPAESVTVAEPIRARRPRPS
jgi:tRNA A-37 threonylcarbamoyl transferase component Bud32